LIAVLEGELLYRILETDLEEIHLSPTIVGTVEPTVPHKVVSIGKVEFYIEFVHESTD
jgi:hypothetical protein